MSVDYNATQVTMSRSLVTSPIVLGLKAASKLASAYLTVSSGKGNAGGGNHHLET